MVGALTVVIRVNIVRRLWVLLSMRIDWCVMVSGGISGFDQFVSISRGGDVGLLFPGGKSCVWVELVKFIALLILPV